MLGPLLFLLFVNDLPEWIVSNLKMFADDTKLWITLRSAGTESSKHLPGLEAALRQFF